MKPLEQIDYFADVPAYVEAELDRKIMTVRDILALDRGAVIKMTRSAGENIEILVGGAPLGSGEVVIVDERVGVRITDFREED